MKTNTYSTELYKRYKYYFLAIALLFSVALHSCKSSKKRKSTPQRTTTTKPMTNRTPASTGEKIVVEEKVDELENLDSKASRRMQMIDQVLATANSYTGTKHKMGGTTKKGIDCSGLVLVSYKSIDLPLPRTTSGQMGIGKAVKISDLQVGDLVFFTYPGGKKVTHVGIVKEVRGHKNVIFIHTSSSKGVRDDNVFDNYWRSNFLGARRPLQ